MLLFHSKTAWCEGAEGLCGCIKGRLDSFNYVTRRGVHARLGVCIHVQSSPLWVSSRVRMLSQTAADASSGLLRTRQIPGPSSSFHRCYLLVTFLCPRCFRFQSDA